MRGGMGNLIKQAKKMQQKIDQTKEELKTIEVEGSSGGGMVQVKATADERILQVSIQKEVVDPDELEMLQDLVLAAVNQALENARKVSEEKMNGVTGGMPMPF